MIASKHIITHFLNYFLFIYDFFIDDFSLFLVEFSSCISSKVRFDAIFDNIIIHARIFITFVNVASLKICFFYHNIIIYVQIFKKESFFLNYC